MSSNRTDWSQYNYYQLLSIDPPNDGTYNKTWREQLKAAYHRTLLLHHPDKNYDATSQYGSTTRHQQQIPIDVIVNAYQILSDPVQHAAYDLDLIIREHDRLRRVPQGRAHSGAETFDLDDLDYNEQDEIWSKPCRCGNEGYQLTEHDLEQNGVDGEIFVNCRGCSLQIRVLFSIAEDQGGDQTV